MTKFDIDLFDDVKSRAHLNHIFEELRLGNPEIIFDFVPIFSLDGKEAQLHIRVSYSGVKEVRRNCKRCHEPSHGYLCRSCFNAKNGRGFVSKIIARRRRRNNVN